MQNRSLLSSNKELKGDLTDTSSEQADVYVYLHKKLDENYNYIASLEDKLEDLEEENESLKSLAQREIDAAAKATAEEQARMQHVRTAACRVCLSSPTLDNLDPHTTTTTTAANHGAQG